MKKLARQWTIIDGKLPDQVVAFIRNQRGKMLLILKEKKEKRSLKQNAYYWAYLQIISQETGNEVDDLHEYFKRKHLPAQEIKVLGRTIKIPSSTADLASGQFCEYIKRIEVETGVLAPDPNDLYL